MVRSAEPQVGFAERGLDKPRTRGLREMLSDRALRRGLAV